MSIYLIEWQASRLTVDSIVHDETPCIGNSLGFLGVTALVVIRQPDSLSSTTVPCQLRGIKA